MNRYQMIIQFEATIEVDAKNYDEGEEKLLNLFWRYYETEPDMNRFDFVSHNIYDIEEV